MFLGAVCSFHLPSCGNLIIIPSHPRTGKLYVQSRILLSASSTKHSPSNHNKFRRQLNLSPSLMSNASFRTSLLRLNLLSNTSLPSYSPISSNWFYQEKLSLVARLYPTSPLFSLHSHYLPNNSPSSTIILHLSSNIQEDFLYPAGVHLSGQEI